MPKVAAVHRTATTRHAKEPLWRLRAFPERSRIGQSPLPATGSGFPSHDPPFVLRAGNAGPVRL